MELPQMEQDKINDIINRLDVESIKPEEIDTFIMGMRKRLMEKALEGELAAHLGYEKYARDPGSNSRNGKSRKTVKTERACNDFCGLLSEIGRDPFPKFNTEPVQG